MRNPHGGIGAQPHSKIGATAPSGQGASRKGGARPDRRIKIKKIDSENETGGEAARRLAGNIKQRAAEPHAPCPVLGGLGGAAPRNVVGRQTFNAAEKPWPPATGRSAQRSEVRRAKTEVERLKGAEVKTARASQDGEAGLQGRGRSRGGLIGRSP